MTYQNAHILLSKYLALSHFWDILSLFKKYLRYYVILSSVSYPYLQCDQFSLIWETNLTDIWQPEGNWVGKMLIFYFSDNDRSLSLQKICHLFEILWNVMAYSTQYTGYLCLWPEKFLPIYSYGNNYWW